MNRLDQQDLIVDIFRAEAKNGKHELTARDITQHPLNQKPEETGFLSKLARRLFPQYILGDVGVYRHLDNMRNLGVVRERTEVVHVKDFKLNRRYYRLVGTRSPANQSERDHLTQAHI